MLEQPPTVFVWYSFPVLNIQCNDSHFIPVPAVESDIVTRSVLVLVTLTLHLGCPGEEPSLQRGA